MAMTSCSSKIASWPLVIILCNVTYMINDQKKNVSWNQINLMCNTFLMCRSYATCIMVHELETRYWLPSQNIELLRRSSTMSSLFKKEKYFDRYKTAWKMNERKSYHLINLTEKSWCSWIQDSADNNRQRRGMVKKWLITLFKS